jgi:VDE lipocalin domain
MEVGRRYCNSLMVFLTIVTIIVVTCCSVQSFQLTSSQHRQQYSTRILLHETTLATRLNTVLQYKIGTSLHERKNSNTDVSAVTSKSTTKMSKNNDEHQIIHSIKKITVSTIVGLSILTGGLFTQNPSMIANAASDPTAIVGCLFQKCSVQLGKCIASPMCLANVVCINTCNNRPDEIECQIKCGDIFDNSAIAEFNKCAVSDMSCVPQQQDNGMYPVPSRDVTVPKFNTNFFNGRLYITAGMIYFCVCIMMFSVFTFTSLFIYCFTYPGHILCIILLRL